MIVRNTRRLATVIAVAATLVIGGFASAQSQPSTHPALAMPSAQRVELNKLVQQRNRLAVQLRRADAQASRLMKQGQDATVVHAQQVSVQDQLDLVELRLAILATRYGVAVPPGPGTEGSEVTEDMLDAGLGERTRRAFSRGRERAVEQMRRDTLSFLKSLDFQAFLTGEG
ncbi:MAG: hypothetical protein GY715_07310 [Planctomycetes bacterium]|nr:hypothetical protein [Planctomycetota bacterium]